MKLKLRFYQLLLFVTVGLVALSAQAGGERMYQVTVTNLTKGETITPIFVASHKEDVSLFSLGEAASEELVAIAESGNIQPLSDHWLNSGVAHDIATNGALLAPGASTTIVVKTAKGYEHISVAAMLIPTNDGFIAANGITAPKKGNRTVMSPAYDAGSETNDELCANIPGPACGGEGLSVNDSGEGYVHIHGGISGKADLDASSYDWRNPTAKITITRMK